MVGKTIEDIDKEYDDYNEGACTVETFTHSCDLTINLPNMSACIYVDVIRGEINEVDISSISLYNRKGMEFLKWRGDELVTDDKLVKFILFNIVGEDKILSLAYDNYCL